MIIDFHTHTFPPDIAEKTIPKLAAQGNIKNYTNGTKADLSNSMKNAGIDYSVLLPIATKPTQTVKLNRLAAETNETSTCTGLISFGTVHPENKNYKEILKEAKELGIKGIKLHPHYQCITSNHYFTICKIVEEIENLDMITIFHAGLDVAFKTDALCKPTDFLNLYNDVKPTKLVLAHMGGWRFWDEVEEKLCSLPIYFDTAFSLGKFIPEIPDSIPPDECNCLSNEQFIRIVKKHGVEKFLFGSDSPWSDQAKDLKALEHSGLTKTEFSMIKGKNAKKLLGI